MGSPVPVGRWRVHLCVLGRHLLRHNAGETITVSAGICISNGDTEYGMALGTPCAKFGIAWNSKFLNDNVCVCEARIRHAHFIDKTSRIPTNNPTHNPVFIGSAVPPPTTSHLQTLPTKPGCLFCSKLGIVGSPVPVVRWRVHVCILGQHLLDDNVCVKRGSRPDTQPGFHWPCSPLAPPHHFPRGGVREAVFFFFIRSATLCKRRSKICGAHDSIQVQRRLPCEGHASCHVCVGEESAFLSRRVFR